MTQLPLAAIQTAHHQPPAMIDSVSSDERSGIPEALSNLLLASDSGTNQTGGISDPYAESVWVMSAINSVTGPVKSAPLCFSDAPDGEKLNLSPQLTAFMATPCKTVDGEMMFEDFIELTLLLRDIQGNAFWIMPGDWDLATGARAGREPLILASRHQMTPFFAGNVFLGWAYRDAVGNVIDLAPEQVINIKGASTDLASPWGVPKWAAAKPYAESEVSAVEAARRMADENGDLGPYVTAANNAALSAEQRTQITAALRQRFEARKRGKFLPTILGADLVIQQPEISAASGDFSSARGLDREAIYIAFGVPPAMSKSMTSYSIGASSDLYRLLICASIPAAKSLAPHLSRVARAFEFGNFGKSQGASARAPRQTFHAWFDFSGHPAMQAAREDKFKIAKEIFSTGVPWETINETLSLGMASFPGWDVGFLPASLTPVESLIASANKEGITIEPAAEKKTFEDDQLTRELSAEFTRNRAKQKADADAARDLEEQRAADERQKLWETIDAKKKPFRKKLEKAVKGQILNKAWKPTMAAINADKTLTERSISPGVNTRSLAEDLLFSVDDLTTGLTAVNTVIGGEAIKAGGQDFITDEWKSEETFDSENQEVIDQLMLRENYMKGAADEIHTEVLESLAEGIDAGETQAELSARVKEVFVTISNHRANTISITEVGTAYEAGRFLSFKQMGITKKGWLSSQDGKVRDTHLAVDGTQIIDIDATFKVGNAELLYPLDDSGGSENASEVIGCRCVLTAEV